MQLILLKRRKFIGSIIVLFQLLMIFPLIGKAQDEEIDFPDYKLQAAINAQLMRQQDSKIYKSDLESLSSLSLNNKNIENLDGLQYATNLETLDLGNNYFTDLKPIENLNNLKKLCLGNNNITDIGFLSNLTNLENLSLSFNKISNLAPLGNLRNLQSLDLNANSIIDISTLSSLSNLQNLTLEGNQLTDISPLANLTNLQDLDLYQNKIIDISPIRNLKGLYYLNLSRNKIKDITSLKNLKKLESELDLSNNQITDISPLANGSNISCLNLSNNQITDINPISNYTQLAWLLLDSNPIKDISPIANLKNISLLRLNFTDITDISPLADLTKLSDLGLQNIGLSDISSLSNLHNLQYLYLSENRIADIKPLGSLINLIYLDLNNNQITDSTPIDRLQIRYLFLQGNFLKNRYDQYSYTISENYREISVGKNQVTIPLIWQLNGNSLTHLDYHLKNCFKLETKNNNVETILNDDGTISVKGISDGDDQITLQFTNPELNQVIKIKMVDITPPTVPEVNPVGDNSTMISGKSEIGSTINVKAGTSVIGTTLTKDDGTFSVPIVLQKAGTKLLVTATDGIGNISEAKEVTVKDSQPPTINGATDTTIDTGETFDVSKGVTAKDNVDGDLTSLIKITGTVNTQKLGTYTLTYTVTDKSRNTAIVIRKITVIDKVKPVISGAANKTIPINSAFNLKIGVTAKDNVDGDLTSLIKIIGSVNTKKKGTYTLTYTVGDKSGNTAVVSRKITVIDNVKPVISGATAKTIKLKSTFNPKTGITAKDNVDGDLTNLIKITGTVNTKKKGTYTLTYTVTDKSGNAAVVTRKITVK